MSPSLLIPVVATVLALVAAWGGGTFGRFLAAALLLGVGWRAFLPLWERKELDRFRDPLRRHLPTALMVLLWAALFWELILGRPPASRDHGIHYFQTRVLVQDLIPEGQLIGWSESLNVGYPFGDSYPILGYLVTGASHLLTGGLVPLRMSYAWGLLAIWTLAAWAIWRMAYLVAEELAATQDIGISPAWAAFIAAGLWLLDPGGSRQGGWNYLMFHGVWPQLLSTALWMASLPLSWDAFRKPSPRRIALCSLCLGGAVLAHPFGMVTGAMSAIAWPAVLLASGRLRTLPDGALRTWAATHVLGALICVGWVVVFLASSKYMGRSPVPWEPLGELVTQLLAGELFDHHRAWVGPLAIVGAVVLCWRRQSLGWLVLTLLLGLLLLGSQASVTVLRLDLLVSAFKNMQFPRLSIAMKPLLFVLAGLGAAFLLAAVARVPHVKSSLDAMDPKRLVAGFLGALVLAPVVVSVVDEGGRFVDHPVAALQTLEGSVHAEAERALTAELAREADALGERRMAVAFLRHRMGGGTFPLFGITDAGARVVLDSHVPAVNYRYRVRRRTATSLRSLGVTHVIHDRPLEGSDRALLAELEPVGSFGTFQLARLTPDDSALGTPVGGIDPNVSGPEASWRAVVVERERVVLEIESAEPGAKLKVNIGDYRKWVARDASGPLEREVRERFGGVPGTEITLRGPGRVELRYETPWVERVWGLISVGSTGLAFVLLFFGRPVPFRPRRAAVLGHRWATPVGLGGLAIVILVGGGLVLRHQHLQLERTWMVIAKRHAKRSLLGQGDPSGFGRDLVVAQRFSVAHQNPRRCDGLLGKDALADCNPRGERPRISMLYRSPYLYRCLDVQVPAHGWTEVTLRAEHLAIGFVSDSSQRRGGDALAYRVPNMKKFTTLGRRRKHFQIDADEHGGAVVIELQNEGSRAAHVCISAADIE